MTDAEFRAAIAANPADDDERLVYADWLLQRGDPRGELIHVQCAIARGEPGLAEREQELLAAHGADWLGPWHAAHAFVFDRGFLDALVIEPAEFAAGLPDAIDIPRSLRFVWRGGGERERGDAVLVAIAPRLAAVERLAIDNHAVGEDALRALSSLPRLRTLELDDTDTGDDGIEALVTGGFGALERLAVQSNRVTDHGAMALAAWSRFEDLRELDLSSIDIYHPTCNDVGDLGALALAGAAGRLARLDLGENPRLGDGAAIAMAGLPQLAALRSLSLEFTAVSDPGAIALAGLEGLEHLDLGHTRIGDGALAALLAMPSLRELPLNGTQVSLAGLELVLGSRLVATDLRFESIDIRGELADRLRARFPGVAILDD